MITANDVLWVLSIPAIIALAIALIGWVKPSTFSAIAGAIAFSAAALFAQWRIFGAFRFVPAESAHRIFILVSAIGVAAIVIGVLRLHFAVQLIAWAVLLAGASAYFFEPRIRNQWTTAESVGWIAGIAISSAIVTAMIERLSQKTGGASLAILLAILAGASGNLILLNGVKNMGMQMLSLTAIAGALAVAALLLPQMNLSYGAASAWTAVFCIVLARSTLFASVPLYAAGLCALAAIACWSLQLPFVRSRKPIVRTILSAVIILIPLSAAIFPSVMDFIRKMHEKTSEGW